MTNNSQNIKKKISKDFIKILKNICGKKVSPLHEPFFTKEEKKSLESCINSTFVSTKSSLIKKFEKKIATYTKSKNVIAVINGTSALQICLIASGLKAKEEVFLPSFNFVAAANAAVYCGGTPHFLDIDAKTLSVDPIKFNNYLEESFIIKNKKCYNKNTKQRVRAIIIPHLFGHPAKIDNLVKIARKNNLFVIEDAAESLGSFYKKKHTGTFGDLGVLSFNGNKIITTGGGGAIISNRVSLTKKIRILVDVSKKNHNWKFDYYGVGYNMKMPGLNAALGNAQIKSIEKMVKIHRLIFRKYKTEIIKSKFFDLVREPVNSRSNYWLQNIILKDQYYAYRDYLIELSNKNGYLTRTAWTLLHNLNHFKKCPKSNLDTSANMYKRIISLPSSPSLINKK